MTTPEDQFHVVTNDEEQYSVWRATDDIPAGWTKTGFTGPQADCLAHIDEVWQDMRPESLRTRMADS